MVSHRGAASMRDPCDPIPEANSCRPRIYLAVAKAEPFHHSFSPFTHLSYGGRFDIRSCVRGIEPDFAFSRYACCTNMRMGIAILCDNMQILCYVQSPRLKLKIIIMVDKGSYHSSIEQILH